MGEIQSSDPKSAFCFMGDFNCHHSEWLGSRVTNSQGMATFDFSTLTDCSQLLCGPTHRGGGIDDLDLTKVPDLCQVSVGPSLSRSDHSALFLMLMLVEPAPHFVLAFRTPLLSIVNWTGVRDSLSSIRWGPIFKSQSMIEDIDNQVSEVLLRFVPMVTFRRRSMILLGLTMDAGLHSIERRVHIFVDLAVILMLAGIGLCMHVVRQKHFILLSKLVILSNVLRDLKLTCSLVIGGEP